MNRQQAEFIVDRVGGEVILGDGYEVYVQVGDIDLFLGKKGIRILTDPEKGCRINTSIAHEIELKVALIEHAEEMAIVAGLGDPRTK